MTNINNTRSDIAYLIKVLADIARDLDKKLGDSRSEAAQAFKARVKSLVEDVPDLPNFSRFHDAFRANPQEQDVRGRHARRLLPGVQRRELRAHQARQQGDRRPAEERAGAGLGQLRHPVSARVSRSWCRGR